MSLLKKNKHSALVPTNPSLKNKNTFEISQRKIVEGLSRKTASTGTPIGELHGGAKFMAQLSNIGGGSKETGGGGIKDGFNTITTYVDANAKIQVQSQSFPPQKQIKRIKNR